jgi:hypothetical protein
VSYNTTTIDVQSSGTNVLIDTGTFNGTTNSGGRRIRVVRVVLTVPSAVVVKFQAKPAGTARDLFPLQLSAGAVVEGMSSDDASGSGYLFQTLAGEKLQFDLGSAVRVTGLINWIDV